MEAINEKPNEAIESEAAPAIEAPSDGNAPDDAAANPGPAATADEDLSQLLEEYDAATERPVDVDQLLVRDNQAADSELLNGISEREARLEQAALQARHQAYIQNELAEFKGICDTAQAGLADLPHLPKNYAETWLIAEAARNPDLRTAWDNRNNPRLPVLARQQIAARLNGTLARLYKEARQLPDPEATGDRDAVIAAMKSGAGRASVPEPAPNYSDMSNNEYRKTIRSQYGFDPGV